LSCLTELEVVMSLSMVAEGICRALPELILGITAVQDRGGAGKLPLKAGGLQDGIGRFQDEVSSSE